MKIRDHTNRLCYQHEKLPLALPTCLLQKVKVTVGTALLPSYIYTSSSSAINIHGMHDSCYCGVFSNQKVKVTVGTTHLPSYKYTSSSSAINIHGILDSCYCGVFSNQKVKVTVGTAHLPSYNLYIKQFSHKYTWYA
jgi:hypothetical protein